MDGAVDSLNSRRDPDENEFVDASQRVYDGVRDVRRAVLLIKVSSVLLIRVSSAPHPGKFCSSSG